MCEILKPKKVLNKFLDKWLSNEEYKDWIEKRDDYTAVCRLCKRDFKVQY